MKKWISIILAAAFVGASVNAIAQGKKDGKDQAAAKKATAEEKKDSKKKAEGKKAK
jgi:hypothetical protein